MVRYPICELIVLLCASVVLHAAEMREWKDAQGNPIEAKFVKFFGTNKVLLEDVSGKSRAVPVKGLSKEDQAYLADLVPPKIKLDVKQDLKRETIDSGEEYLDDRGLNTHDWTVKEERIKLLVSVKQTSKQKSTQELVAHVYVIAKDFGKKQDKLLTYYTQKFSLQPGQVEVLVPVEATAEYRVDNYSYNTRGKGDVIEEAAYQENNGKNTGEKYEGYLVYVVNQSGVLVESKSTDSSFVKVLEETDLKGPEYKLKPEKLFD